ncbi:MAG: hypothetical protein QW343_02230 [Candidatus Norongarragalinales archaeon]
MAADALLQIVSILTLVASILVGGYALVYSWILWDEAKQGKARKDWRISLFFYAGVFLIVSANFLVALDDLHAFGGRYASPFLVFAALLCFFKGFSKRAHQEVK